MTTTKDFYIPDLFELHKGKRLTKADQRPGTTPFVGSTENNNGITAYIDQSPIFDGNAITVSYNGSVGQVFYQEEPFWASDDVNVLYLKEYVLNPRLFCYLGTCLRKAGRAFSYTRKWNLERMRSTMIAIPVTSEGEPDWDCMEKVIDDLAQQCITQLKQYLAETGL